MIRTMGAAPPYFLVRPCYYMLRGEIPVLCRVPLLHKIRMKTGE